MNIEERAAQAAAWKATGQCNCAQAVLKAFEDKLPVDADIGTTAENGQL